jgi:hypothetical protein
LAHGFYCHNTVTTAVFDARSGGTPWSPGCYQRPYLGSHLRHHSRMALYSCLYNGPLGFACATLQVPIIASSQCIPDSSMNDVYTTQLILTYSMLFPFRRPIWVWARRLHLMTLLYWIALQWVAIGSDWPLHDLGVTIYGPTYFIGEVRHRRHPQWRIYAHCTDNVGRYVV